MRRYGWLVVAGLIGTGVFAPSEEKGAGKGDRPVLAPPPIQPNPVALGAPPPPPPMEPDPAGPPSAVKLPETPPGAPAAKSADSTKPLTLDIRDMDVVEVLKLLSKQSGVNIVIGKNVAGRVTLFMNNVGFWEALGTILDTRDLAYVREDNLIRVITSSDFERLYGEPFGDKTVSRTFSFQHIKAKSAKDILDQFKSRVGNLVVNENTNALIVRESPERLARFDDLVKEMDRPVETRVITLSYGLVEDVVPKIQPLVSRDFGSLQSDKRSNSLVVTDNPARLNEIAAVVKAFDVKNKAVLIEAKMVQVVLSDEYQWGINWERAFRGQSGGRAYSGGVVLNSDPKLTTLGAYRGTSANGASAAGLSGITGNLTALSGIQLSGAVNLLEEFGRTRILSSPRVAALNNQEARIKVVTKEIFITNTVVNPGGPTQAPVVTETPNEKEVGVVLAVTPTIGDDGFVTLRIKPEVSSVESTVKTANGSAIPIIRTSEAEASLVVKDGVTVVMGGLIDDSRIDSDAGVPFLSRIPLIGLLFKSKSHKTKKTELVIFLTPHIIDGSVEDPRVSAAGPEPLEAPRGAAVRKGS